MAYQQYGGVVDNVGRALRYDLPVTPPRYGGRAPVLRAGPEPPGAPQLQQQQLQQPALFPAINAGPGGPFRDPAGRPPAGIPSGLPDEAQQRLMAMNRGPALEFESRIAACEAVAFIVPELTARLRVLERRAAVAEQAAAAAQSSASELSQMQTRLMQLADAAARAEAAARDAEMRCEVAERRAAEAQSGLARLEASVVAEGRAAAAEERLREDRSAAIREEGRRRTGALADEMMALSRDVDALRGAAELNAELAAQLQKLEARVTSSAGFVDRLRVAEVETVNQSAEQFALLRLEQGRMQEQVASLSVQLREERTARAEADAAAAEARRQMETQISAREEKMARRLVAALEAQTQKVARRVEDVKESAEERDSAIVLAAEDQLVAFTKTAVRDKRSTVDRLLLLERVIREEHHARAAAEAGLRAAVDTLARESVARLGEERGAREGREAKLRDQMAAALLKMRAFARDLEEEAERGRRSLQEVVRLEIQARLVSVEKAREEAELAAGRARAAASKEIGSVVGRVDVLERKAGIVVAAQRALHDRQTTADGEMRRMQVSLNAAMDALRDQLEEAAATAALEDQVTRVETAEELQATSAVVENLRGELKGAISDNRAIYGKLFEVRDGLSLRIHGEAAERRAEVSSVQVKLQTLRLAMQEAAAYAGRAMDAVEAEARKRASEDDAIMASLKTEIDGAVAALTADQAALDAALREDLEALGAKQGAATADSRQAVDAALAALSAGLAVGLAGEAAARTSAVSRLDSELEAARKEAIAVRAAVAERAAVASARADDLARRLDASAASFDALRADTASKVGDQARRSDAMGAAAAAAVAQQVTALKAFVEDELLNAAADGKTAEEVFRVEISERMQILATSLKVLQDESDESMQLVQGKIDELQMAMSENEQAVSMSAESSLAAIKDLDNKLEELREDSSVADSRIEELQASLKQLAERLREDAAENAATQEEHGAALASLEAAIEAARREAGEMHEVNAQQAESLAAHDAQLDESLAAVGDRVAKLEGGHEETAGRVSRVEGGLEDTAGRVSEVQAEAVGRMAQLEVGLETTTGRVTALEEEQEAAAAATAANAAAASAEAAELSEQIREVQASVGALNEQIPIIDGRVSAVEGRLTTAEGTLSDADAAAGVLHARMEVLEKVAEKAEVDNVDQEERIIVLETNVGQFQSGMQEWSANVNSTVSTLAQKVVALDRVVGSGRSVPATRPVSAGGPRPSPSESMPESRGEPEPAAHAELAPPESRSEPEPAAHAEPVAPESHGEPEPAAHAEPAPPESQPEHDPTSKEDNKFWVETGKPTAKPPKPTDFQPDAA